MFKINKNILLLTIIICISLSYAARASMEFTSAKTYARIEKNLPKAEEFGLIALKKEPNNSFIPYFLAKEVFMMQKKQKEAGEMFIEALNRPDSKLEKPFRIGDTKYKTVHQATTLHADDFYNSAIDFYNKENIDNALTMINVCLKLDPFHKRSYMLLSEIEGSNNNISAAVAYLDKILEENFNLTDQEEFDINLQKVNYFRKDKKFQQGIEILTNFEDKQGDNILLKRSLFFLYIDMGNIDTAIPYGNELFIAMEDDPEVPMALISECAFNLGILYRNQGSTLYNNKVIKYFSDSEKTNDKTNKHLDYSYQVIESFELAKEYFQNSTNYDEEGTSISKQYKKDMRKLIKNINNEVIPQLEALLK